MTNKLNYDRSQMYVGFQRNGNGSHTMGNMFVDVLKEYKPYVVVHLHPKTLYFLFDFLGNLYASTPSNLIRQMKISSKNYFVYVVTTCSP